MQNKIMNCSIGIFSCLLVMLAGCENTAGIESGTEHIPVESGHIQLESGHRMLVADDSGLPAEKQELILEVSERLAVAYIHELNPEKTDIPEKVIGYFYNGLIHLFNSELAEAEEITDHRLVVASPPSAHDVTLWVREQEPWLETLEETKTSTGVPEIDELISRFDMYLIQYHDYSFGDIEASVRMHSDTPINVFAVADLFSELPQFEWAGPDIFTAGGRNITATAHQEYLLLDITVGWGDCMSGCINKLNHLFRVSADGQVELAE